MVQAPNDSQPTRDRISNFGDLAKATPPFKDYLNNLHAYQYIQQLENPDAMQPRHNQITQQYSSSTDEGCEGCDTDHGGKNLSFLRMSKVEREAN